MHRDYPLCEAERFSSTSWEASSGPIALPACGRISQHNPIETIIAAWLRPHGFERGVTGCRARPLTVTLLGLCRAVTGDHGLYQTMKLWFRRCLTYPNNCFFDPIHYVSCKLGAFSSLLEGCLTRISKTILVGCHVCAEHGGLEP